MQKQDQLHSRRCQKAIDLILSSQKEKKSYQFRGGWRYTPRRSRCRSVGFGLAIDGTAVRQERRPAGARSRDSRCGGVPEAIVRFAAGSQRNAR